MGPIQTAIGQLMGAAGGAALVGKKIQNENERQVAKEERNAAKQKAKKSKAVEIAVQEAQKKKIDMPKQILFSESTGEALGTSNEIASVLATQSLHNASNSKRRSRNAMSQRRLMLKMKADPKFKADMRI